MMAPFSPFTLAGHTLNNRLVAAPMTTSQSHADGSPSEQEALWLERLADDDYGIVISCAAAVSRTSIAFRNQLSLGVEDYVPALSALATRIRRPGQLAVVQLCHGGSRTITELTGRPPHSASRYELPVPGFVPPLEFSTPQIEAVIEDFAAAAERAARAGFGGIEIHGANGYLQTQFTSTMTNRRSDAWGGSLENRARFPRECVRAIRASVPANFVVGYRMSFEGFGLDTGLDVDDNVRILEWLAEDGISWGHISHFDYGARSVKYPEQPLLTLIRERVNTALPLMIAGGVKSRSDAERALELGADLVAFARAAIGNAQLPAKLAAGERLAETPFSRSHLERLAVSDAFIRYMTETQPVASMNIVA
jgi:2,4-dienoyl-CoA reductase-like NADH-dependent reductase (Old Yellow Enzyme family)